MNIQELVEQMDRELSQEQKERIKTVVDEKKSDLEEMESRISKAKEYLKKMKAIHKVSKEEYNDLLNTDINSILGEE